MIEDGLSHRRSRTFLEGSAAMLPFIRSDLAQLTAYTPHPGGSEGQPVDPKSLDRLDTNESPYDLPEALKQELGQTYQRLIEANRYPDGGHQTLKEAIAEYATEAAHLPKGAIASHQISVGNGSDELIRSLLIATCLGGEGSILVAQPTFSMYGILAKTLGIPVLTIGRSLETFEMDLEAAQKAIAPVDPPQHPPVRTVFVLHPNSPTANPLTEAEIDWLRSLPQNILAVIDEAYFEFSGQSLVGELPEHPNWVILRTFSKAFRLAAHRVGYAIAHPDLVAVLEKVRLPYNLPSFTQAAAQTALLHRHALLTAIPQIVDERDRLLTALGEIPSLQVWPSTANFIFVRPTESAGFSAADLGQGLRTQGTLVRTIADGLRITVGSPQENARTLSRLQSAIAQLNSPELASLS